MHEQQTTASWTRVLFSLLGHWSRLLFLSLSYSISEKITSHTKTIHGRRHSIHTQMGKLLEIQFIQGEDKSPLLYFMFHMKFGNTLNPRLCILSVANCFALEAHKIIFSQQKSPSVTCVILGSFLRWRRQRHSELLCVISTSLQKVWRVTLGQRNPFIADWL